jgi:hypothetical protein
MQKKYYTVSALMSQAATAWKLAEIHCPSLPKKMPVHIPNCLLIPVFWGFGPTIYCIYIYNPIRYPLVPKSDVNTSAGIFAA